MQIKAINAAVLGVEDIDAARRFYRTFGLTEREHGHAGASYTTRDQSEIILRTAADALLPAPVAAGSTIREIVWGVESAADIESIGTELSKDRGVIQDADGTLHSQDEDGYGIAFRIDTRVAAAPQPNLMNIYGAEPLRGVNSRVEFSDAIHPASIAHVVVFSPDVPKAERFYTERLRFRVSDRFLNGRGVFMRSAASRYHHNMFLIHAPNKGLHHIAFPVTDFNEIVLGGQKILKDGWTTRIGPGRHRIGSNFFWYFNSPCGGAMELTADMDCADDDWVSREWDFIPQNTAAWSLTFVPPASPGGA
jgi:catechol 2,3-dioxygenase-like lactoylglutathione lyase family enzyme